MEGETKEKILIVDDEPTILDFLETVLKECNYECFKFDNANKAIKFLKDNPGISLIISDVFMPEMNGLTFLKKIKSVHKDLPVILITGRGTIDIAIEALRYGAENLILKPFSDIKSLLHSIDKAVKQYKLSLKVKKLTDELKIQNECMKLEINVLKALNLYFDKVSKGASLKEQIKAFFRTVCKVSKKISGAVSLNPQGVTGFKKSYICIENSAVYEFLKQLRKKFKYEEYEEIEIFKGTRKSIITDFKYIHSDLYGNEVILIWPDTLVLSDFQRTVLNLINTTLLSNLKSYFLFLKKELNEVEEFINTLEEAIALVYADNVLLCNNKFKEFFSNTKEFFNNIDLDLKKARVQYKDFIYSIYVTSGFSKIPDSRIVVIRDITEEARQKELMNEFLSIISHELKTPLATIMTSFEVLKLAPHNFEKLFSVMWQEAKRLRGLINKILLLGKLESKGFEPQFSKLNLKHIVDNAISALEILASKKNIKFNILCKGKYFFIKGDKELIEIVIYNLLENACKYNKDNGRIYVSLKKVKDNIIIKIEDTGKGIPAKYRKKIFQKFFQVERALTRKHLGVGLGLFLVKRLLDMHNATIFVRDSKYKGACFIVKIPEYSE